MVDFIGPTFVEKYKFQLLIICISLIAAGAAVLAFNYAKDSPFRLRADEAKARILRGDIKVVLDVRTDVEWWAGHYPGAVHIPTGELLMEAYHMLPNIAEPILIYCNTGQRARHATEVLRSLGYKSVWYIAEGYWRLL
jgi:phage shock protein E